MFFSLDLLRANKGLVLIFFSKEKKVGSDSMVDVTFDLKMVLTPWWILLLI